MHVYFCLASIRKATSFFLIASPVLARHRRWHLDFQLFRRVFDEFPWTLLPSDRWNISCLSGIAELPIFDSRLLLFSALRFARHIFQISGHKWPGLDVVCFFRWHPSGSSSIVETRVKSVDTSDRSYSTLIFQRSSMRRSSIIKPKVVLVGMTTSIDRNGFGSDSSLGT